MAVRQAKGKRICKDVRKWYFYTWLYYPDGSRKYYTSKCYMTKKEALQLFLRAEEIFRAPEWYYCWWRPAAMMFAAQCYDKQGNTAEAIRRCESLLTE